jgi:hypothetical protein
VGSYCFTNRIKITAMQQTLREEGDREIFTHKKRGKRECEKWKMNWELEGKRMKGKERREKENPLRAGEEKGGGIFVEGKKGEYGVEVKE